MLREDPTDPSDYIPNDSILWGNWSVAEPIYVLCILYVTVPGRLPRAFCVGNNSHITLMADIICDSDDCRCEGRSRSPLPSHCSAGQAGGQEGGVLQLSVCPGGSTLAIF